MLHAYLTKTSVFDKKAQATKHSTNGVVNGSNGIVTAKADEEEDPIGGYSGMFKRAVYLGIALTIKRFATMYLQSAQMPAQAWSNFAACTCSAHVARNRSYSP